jgi:Tfp pilus assembly protein PilV
MNALKALVIGMGVLILIGIGLVGYGLTRGKQAAQQPQQAQQAQQAQVQMQDVAIEPHEPYKATVPVPASWRLEQMSAAGDRVVLRFSSPEGDRLMVYSARTGQPVGTFTLVPADH